jgi:DNA-binding MarR family transcriptional regulator
MSSKIQDDFQMVGYVLKQAQHALRIRMDRLLQAENLTMAQYVALSLIEASPRITNAEIARRAFVTPQTMHRIVTDVESAGLVGASADPKNKRLVLRSLTDRGRKVIAYAHEVATTVEQQMLRGFTQKDRQQFAHYLQNAIENLEREDSFATPGQEI